MGLTLALRLAERGKKVTVYEASDRLGGLADAWQVGDLTWDRHYHVTLLSDAHLRQLLKDLGLENDLIWGTTKTDFYTGGRFSPLNNAIDYLKFPPLGLIDKVRLAGTILYASRIADGRPLEKIPVATWLTKLSGRRTYEEIWQPLLRAKLGDNYKQASAAFIWAIIRRLYAARRSGLKTEMFGYIDGGYHKVFARFAEVLAAKGVGVRLNAPVSDIRSAPTGLEVESKGATASFDRVVVTTATPLAARICSSLTDAERRKLDGFLYQGILCASVVLKRPLRGAYITYIADPSVPYTAVIEMSALVDKDRQLGGNALVYLPRYVTADDPFLQSSDAEIEERFRAALQRMYPDLKPNDILAFRLSRVRQVLAVSTLNYTENLPPVETSVPGLSILTSAHIVNGTLNVNETVALVETALPGLLAGRNAEHQVRESATPDVTQSHVA